MTSRIHQIRQNSNKYVANIDANIQRVLETKPVSDKILDINRSQFIKHKDAEDRSLIHKNTGSSNLSKAYAKKTNKRKPNFFVTGAFFDGMIFIVASAKNYFVSGRNFVTKYLAGNYGNIFGVAPSQQPSAKRITTKAIGQDYKSKLFSR